MSAQVQPRRKSGLRRVTLIRAGSEALALALSMAGSILVARAVGPATLGAYVLATLVAQATAIVGDFGTGQALQVNVGRGRIPMRDAVLGSLGLRLLASTGAALLAALLVLLLVPAEQGLLRLLVLAGVLVGPLGALSFTWALVAAARIEMVSTLRVGGPLACLIVAVVFIHEPKDAPYLVGYLLAPSVLSAFVGTLFYLQMRRGGGFAVQSRIRAREMVPGAKHFLVASISGFLFSSADRLLLGLLGMQSVLGLYDVANRMVSPFSSVFGVVSDMHYRSLARADADRDDRAAASAYQRAAILLLLPTLPVGLGATLFGKDLIGVMFGPSYEGAFPYLVPLAWGVTIGYLAACYTLPLAAWGLAARVAATSVVGAVTAAATGFLLIIPLGGVGAALTRSTAQLAAGAVAYPARRPYVNRTVLRCVAGLLPPAILASILGAGVEVAGFDGAWLTGIVVFCTVYGLTAAAVAKSPRLWARVPP